MVAAIVVEGTAVLTSHRAGNRNGKCRRSQCRILPRSVFVLGVRFFQAPTAATDASEHLLITRLPRLFVFGASVLLRKPPEPAGLSLPHRLQRELARQQLIEQSDASSCAPSARDGERHAPR